MHTVLSAGAALLLVACAAGPRPASASPRVDAEADAGAAPAYEMTAQRMKADLQNRQREEDDRRSRDAFIQRNQQP
jgi:hypothetical protein